MYFNETIVKNCTYLIRQSAFQCTDVKTCFLILWFNCEFRIETDNEKYKQKCPDDSRFSVFKTKMPCMFFFEKRERN